MKTKISYLIFAFLIMNFKIYSQISIGIEAGTTFSSFNYKPSNLAFGIKTGINFLYKINNSIDLEGDLLFYQKGQKTKRKQDIYILGQNMIAEPATEKIIGIYKLNYLELPVNVNYNFKNLFISSGIYFSYALDCHFITKDIIWNEDNQLLSKYSASENLLDSKFSSWDYNTKVNKLDYGLLLGIGYRIGKFSIKSNFELGLPYVIDTYDFSLFSSSFKKYKNKSLSLSLQYRFQSFNHSKENYNDTSFNQKDGFIFSFQVMSFNNYNKISPVIGFKIGKAIFFTGYELIKFYDSNSYMQAINTGIAIYPHKNLRRFKLFYQSFVSCKWYGSFVDPKINFIYLGIGFDYFIMNNLSIGYDMNLGYGYEKQPFFYASNNFKINSTFSIKYFLFKNSI